MVLSTSSEDEAPPKKPVTKPKPKPREQSLGAALTKGSTIVTAESLLAENCSLSVTEEAPPATGGKRF